MNVVDRITGDFFIYDPFDYAQDKLIIYYLLFLCGLCVLLRLRSGRRLWLKQQC